MKISVTQGMPKASASRMLLWEKKIFVAFSLLLATLFAQAQNITVKGRVTNEAGAGVPSASVTVKGTTTGVSTNDAGNFEIKAPSNGTLVISSVGFNSIEVGIKGRTTVNATLSNAGTTMEQVVVIGYGTLRKEAVTGSVGSIQGDALRDVLSANISQALQGRIAGVEISQTDSKPGAGMQIRIRGTRSLTATNDPLIVLDGIPFAGSLGDINPNDVKSIDILKDASATAVYGSRSANGVILITTNRGRVQKPRITYNSYFGQQTLFSKYPMMNAQEFLQLRKTAGMYATPGVDEDTTGKTDTDWQDLLLQNGMVTSHDINLAGSTETGNYNFGLGYYKNEGLIPTQQYTRYSLRASIDQQVGKYFRFGFSTNTNNNLSEGSNVGLYGVLSMSPITNPYNGDGTLKRTVKMPLDEQWVYTNDLVESIHDKWLNEQRAFATYNSIYGDVKIPWVEGLKYRVNLGLDFRQTSNGNYTGVGVNSTNAASASTAGISNSQNYHWTLENILTYDRIFAQKHNLNVTGLYSSEQTRYNSSGMSAQNIPADFFQWYNIGQALPTDITVAPGNQSYTLRGLLSWMGRAMYQYDNRYMIAATVRSDGASVLAPGHKWHTYAGASAGWNISNEAFMKNVTWINKLKLRVGYGTTSNQSVNPYQTLGTLNTTPYNFGSTGYQMGLYTSTLPNPNLGWEYTSTWNYGVDFTVLKNRLSGTIEYYKADTKDLLQQVGLPNTAGVPSYLANVGKTQNRGFEISLNGTIIQNKNGWNWDFGVNAYTNHNEIVALASGTTRDEFNGWFVGQNINAIFDYKKLGLWQSTDKDYKYLQTLEPGGKPGMIKVLYTGGYNDDGTPKRQIGPADRQVTDIEPDLQGGFNTNVAYKGFDLAVVGVFNVNGILVSSLYGTSGYLNMQNGRRGNVKVDYWTPTNTDAEFPAPGNVIGVMSGDNPKYGNLMGYFNNSYLKFRSMTLGYNFNHSLINNSSIKLRMYFTVQNPFVLFSPYHKLSGMDPETNSLGNQNQAVTTAYQSRFLVIGTNAPSVRTYLVGLNLSL